MLLAGGKGTADLFCKKNESIEALSIEIRCSCSRHLDLESFGKVRKESCSLTIRTEDPIRFVGSQAGSSSF
jgi:hypothetical protein